MIPRATIIAPLWRRAIAVLRGVADRVRRARCQTCERIIPQGASPTVRRIVHETHVRVDGALLAIQKLRIVDEQALWNEEQHLRALFATATNPVERELITRRLIELSERRIPIIERRLAQAAARARRS